MKHSIFTLILSFTILFTLESGCCKKKDQSKEIDSILSADRQYSQLSVEKGMNTAFLAMFDSSGVLLRRDHEPVEGVQQISKLLMSETDSSFVLYWEPKKAVIAESGELGYSYGIYFVKDRKNGQKIGDGTYVTIWKKSGKEWKAMLDTGNSGLKAEEKPGE
jgi:hypothetical protein